MLDNLYEVITLVDTLTNRMDVMSFFDHYQKAFSIFTIPDESNTFFQLRMKLRLLRSHKKLYHFTDTPSDTL